MEQSNNTSWQQKGFFCCSTKHIEANPLHLSTVTKLGDLNQLFRFQEQSASHRWPWPLYGQWYICLSSSSFFLAFCHIHRHWVQAKWAMLNWIDNTSIAERSTIMNTIMILSCLFTLGLALWLFKHVKTKLPSLFRNKEISHKQAMRAIGIHPVPPTHPPDTPTPHTHMWFSKVQFPVFVWPEFYTILSNPEL